MNLINKIILCICLCSVFTSCEKSEKAYLKELNQNLSDLDSLRKYIEANYENEINDTLKLWLTFVDKDNKYKVTKYQKGYIYDDNVMACMKKLGIKEICLENKIGKTYNDIYFKKKKYFNYPVVSYFYEREGTAKAVKTQTIYYDPINKHWSLYIDSSLP